MELALEGVFFSNFDLKVDDHKTLYSGISYWEALNLSDNATLFANPLYDQVWAFASANLLYRFITNILEVNFKGMHAHYPE